MVAVLGVGMVMVGVGAWRFGIAAIGASLVFGAVVRAVLPDPAAGLLRVRGRVFDTVWMALLGTALVTLAIIVPPGLFA
ncbi:UNVERIFIED_CONTAM: hypothetical protein LK11_47985 [Mumia flava]